MIDLSAWVASFTAAHGRQPQVCEAACALRTSPGEVRGMVDAGDGLYLGYPGRRLENQVIEVER